MAWDACMRMYSRCIISWGELSLDVEIFINYIYKD